MGSNVLNWMVAILLIGLSAVLGYWVQDREAPVEITASKILTPVVKPGEPVKIVYTLTRKKICHVKVEQVLYDHDRVRYSPTVIDYVADPGAKIMGDDPVGLAIEVPKHFAPGTAFHRAVRAYYCNPVHEILQWPIVLVGPDLEFEVRR